MVWLLWLPGLLFSHIFRLPRLPSLLCDLSLQIGLGIAFWPLLILWSTAVGWQWSAEAAQIVAFAVGTGGLITLLHKPKERWLLWCLNIRRELFWITLFIVVGSVTAYTRFQHIRPLVLPNWVDSVHHVMIVRLIVEHGALPDTFAPFYPEGSFSYHWGYHAVVAWMAWLLNQIDPFEIASLILYIGQMFNILVVLMLYAAGHLLFRVPHAGIIAAALGALVSWFPAYYVTWGRYTQLMGILMLAPLMISLWQVYKRPTLGGWVASVLMLSGLALVHLRIAFFALTLVGLLEVKIFSQRTWSPLVHWCASGVAALILTFPWFYKLFLLHPRVLLVVSPEAQERWWSSQNMISWNLFWSPGNPELLSLATGGSSGLLGWGSASLELRVASVLWMSVLGATLLWNRHRLLVAHAFPAPWPGVILMFAWSGTVALLLNLNRFGLPAIGFIHNTSALITLFVPLSLIGAGLLVWAIGCIERRIWRRIATVVLVIIISVYGLYRMPTVVNPSTILVEQADVDALEWIRDNTPGNAKFALNVWRWLGNAYAGSDGGYWISTLTDRRSILPPALYTLTSSYETVNQVNALLDIWARTTSIDDPALRMKLREAGVTHIYIGTKGGHLHPQQLVEHEFVSLVYQRGAVYIFALEEEP
jgi:hypothetical protein